MYIDTITSTEFRKRYASLVEPTRVTANGHVIGTWMPGNLVTVAVTGGHESKREVVHEFGAPRPAPKGSPRR